MSFLTKSRNTLIFVLIVLACYFVPTYQKHKTQLKTDKLADKKVENTAPDLNLICQNLFKEMQKISDQRTTLALEQINQDTRMCLPLMPQTERKKLMVFSDQMYKQFLHIERTPEQEKAFNEYILNQYQIPNIQQIYFEKLHTRDQYLLRHKGQAYVELVESPEGNMVYRRSPQYLANIFAEYFPASEQVFIQELANQNQKSIFSNNNINLLPQEITRRALFWENYIKQYPKSGFRKDADFLFGFYSSLLFIGPPHARVSQTYDGELDIQISHLMEIQALAKQENSILANQSRKFLDFVNIDTEQRLKNIKLLANILKKVDSDPQQLATAQLTSSLNLKVINEADFNKRDCFSDAICH